MSAALALLAAISLGAGTAEDARWNLVWSDEFEGTRIDPDKWNLADNCWGGGNEERQCYTHHPENASVSDGILTITALRKTHTGPAFPIDQQITEEKRKAQASKPFTSARLSTAGHASWLYGRVEVRARLPQGQGTWPAIWMLPEAWKYGEWAASGEIDIMEAVNLGEPCERCAHGRENQIFGTIHFGGEWPANRHIGDITAMPGALDDYHVYSIEWDAEKIVWSVDGTPYAKRAPHEWHSLGSQTVGAPFDHPFHLILNLAIGGRLPESRNRGGVDEGGYPKYMQIDWVRVWQKD